MAGCVSSMSRPRTAQEFIHWLEVGGGARWIRLAALLAGTLALSLLVAFKLFVVRKSVV